MGAAEADVRWAHWVTPSLYVGERTAVESALATTAEQAVAIIRGGGTVRLPEEAWDTAEETLRLLGLSEDEIEAKVHFGKTGRLHPSVRNRIWTFGPQNRQ